MQTYVLSQLDVGLLNRNSKKVILSCLLSFCIFEIIKLIIYLVASGNFVLYVITIPLYFVVYLELLRFTKAVDKFDFEILMLLLPSYIRDRTRGFLSTILGIQNVEDND